MQRFTPTQYLKIDIANSFGLDKLTWDERIQWFDDNAHHMGTLLNQAKEPAMFYAGCKAYNDALNGVPSGYMVSLDATSSGLQLLAVLTGDRKAAELCNVVPTGKREDAYTTIYGMMLDVIQEDGKIDRDGVKEAIMTSLYSSRAVPKRIFGEGALLDVFYDTMMKAAPGAWELNEAMLGLWNSTALSHDWVMPDNFHVHIKVMDRVKETVHFMNQPFDTFRTVNQPTEQGRSLGANTTHAIDAMVVREITARCDYDMEHMNWLYDLLAGDVVPNKKGNAKLVSRLWAHYERTGYLSARILTYLDQDNLSFVEPAKIHELLDSMPERPFKVISLHDCFRVHPNYANDLREQYARQLMLLAKSDLLSDLISQITGKPVMVGKLDHGLWLDIPNTDYALS